MEAGTENRETTPGAGTNNETAKTWTKQQQAEMRSRVQAFITTIPISEDIGEKIMLASECAPAREVAAFLVQLSGQVVRGISDPGKNNGDPKAWLLRSVENRFRGEHLTEPVAVDRPAATECEFTSDGFDTLRTGT